MTNPKIITLDIETSPILAYTWDIWQVNIGLDQILEDWKILSYCAKTLGEPEVRYEDVEHEPGFNDSGLLYTVWEELNDADIVITQNGMSFDHKKLNARFIQEGLPPPSPYKMIDTKVEAKKIAKFTSNRLEWLAQILTDEVKDKHEEFPGFRLWRECLAGNPRAWAIMRKYNPQDVIATEKVYMALRPYMTTHPNLNVYDDSEEMRCSNCGSSHVQQRGYSFTQTGKYRRFQCVDCGTWGRSGYTENTVGKRKALLRG